ncbi:sensory transduction histidine kinase [Paenibacillus larvae subsp. larvae]|uniref:histidine kinase n=1 Tax=Paenibacillus larvae subsp. larvae TaxID=147375 RepID=A0A2L1TWJ4_9BACL|nr:ATP-binding protein [Paenibacillus larvae]AQT85603.1 two-component sensor histidine kinase [Paenibacillus larvae subsp. pulvifaciens]AQZ47617.1 two-component sensor histidine kinase [Paenibacillus larvae subsp. pulvifaciens]AVF24988.1 sensory transduction histidine kinase [Paenibacillus larvae subsp. larvae]AVF29751.1 sensory transduction histidine kinase [Paenibacillus larvae subsp. larvae]MBH0341314.1 histidine kinase [Paenibacillus larvae]
MSIRVRLTLWYSGILAVTLLLFGMGLFLFLNNYVYNTLENQLREEAVRVYDRIQATERISFEKGYSIELDFGRTDKLNTSNTFLQLSNLQFGQLSRSANLISADLKIPLSQDTVNKLKQKADPSGFMFTTEKIANDSFLVYNQGLWLENQSQMIGVFQASVTVTTWENFLNMLKYVLYTLAFAAIGIAATFGWLLSREALKPIDRLIEATNQVQKGTDLDKRILYDGPADEIGRLTHTINNMFARLELVYTELEEAYKTQRRFVSDASHELRTPLTTIRGNVDILEKMWKQQMESNKKYASQEDAEQLQISLEAMHDISSEAHRMSRLVNDLLSLARADAGFQMNIQEMEIKPLVEEVARRAQLLERKAQWIIGDLSALDDAFVLVNYDYLQQLLFIFIENAFKYTPHGEVRLEAQKTDNQIGIQISDTGIGMDKEEIPFIFDRFYRADPSRGKTAGTGLGLAIAKWILDEHKGSIEVTTAKGKGSTFTIWLPCRFLPDLA